jgi:hypothetical protein
VCGCGVWGVAGAPKNKNCHFCEHAPKRSAFFACLNPSCDQVCMLLHASSAVLPLRAGSFAQTCACKRVRHVLARE